MSEEQTNFKVTDRRLFNSDGTPRELSAEETVQIKTDATPLTSETPQAAEATPEAGIDSSAGTPAQSPSDIPDENEIPGVDDPASFANFMMSIASNAASSLGMMEHPITHKRDVDLELGKHWIDVLGILQDKTRGNLSPQEAQILEGLLADLRMQYVSLANATTQKSPRAFSSSDITGGR
jgi:hypothetical protein